MKNDVSFVKKIVRLGAIENPFLEYEDGRYFVPSVEQKNTYHEILLNVISKPLRNVNLVISDGRNGKTTLAKRLVGHLKASPGYDCLPIFLPEHSTPWTPARITKTISMALYNDYETQMPKRIQSIRQNLLDRMNDHGGSAVLIIDTDLPVESIDLILELASWNNYPSETPNSLIQIVIFGRNDNRLIQRQDPDLQLLTNSTRYLSSPPLNEMGEILTRMAENAGFPTLFEERALDYLLEHAPSSIGDLLGLANRCFYLMLESGENQISESTVRQILRSI